MEFEEVAKHFYEKPTEALLQFIDDVALSYSRYLFIKKVIGNTYKGYCTYCKKESYLELKNGKGITTHMLQSTCPNCETRCWLFHAGRGRGKLVDDVYVEFFEKSPAAPNDVVTASGYYVVRDYSESYFEPKLTVYRRAMYLFKNFESVMYKRGYCEVSYEKCKSVFSLHNTMTFGQKLSFMNSAELPDVLNDTPFEYVLPKKRSIGNEYMLEYLSLYLKYPYVEVLVKSNCANVVIDRLQGKVTKDAINWRGKTLDKIFGLPKRDWKHFRKIEEPIETVDLINFKAFRKLDSEEKVFALDLMTFCIEQRGYGIRKMCNILEKTLLSLHEAFKYIQKQLTSYAENFSSTSSVLITWSDYLDTCVEMRLEVEGKHAKPRDLYTMHQLQIQRKKAVADTKLNKKIKQRLRELSDYIFEHGDFIIRPFKSAQELTREGHKLDHCIANYAERYADGETDLFSIRLKSAPRTPLYSVEVSVKDKKIRQIQGFKNLAKIPKEVREGVGLMLNKERYEEEEVRKRA